MSPIDEKAQDMRARDRASIRRDTIVAEIRSIHQLAQQASEDGNIHSQFVVASNDLDSLWVDFVAEDDAVLNSLLDLGISFQYSDALKVEVVGSSLILSLSCGIMKRKHAPLGQSLC